jgi:homogentisate 1,2-dioxygenase
LCASTANPTEDTDVFFRNSYAHEILFVHQGTGDLLSEYGRLPFQEWDYIIIPKGTTYQVKFKNYKKAKLFIIESSTPFDIPKHFRNEYGQLTEELHIMSETWVQISGQSIKKESLK